MLILGIVHWPIHHIFAEHLCINTESTSYIVVSNLANLDLSSFSILLLHERICDICRLLAGILIIKQALGCD